MPRTREDYPGYVSTLGLSIDADPFEILARNEGRRATDTLEIFPEPMVDEQGSVSCLFLVRGVRHIRGAHDAIDTVTVGDELHVLFDPQNEIDALAVLLRTGAYRPVGYVPAFLTSLVHRPLESTGHMPCGSRSSTSVTATARPTCACSVTSPPTGLIRSRPSADPTSNRW